MKTTNQRRWTILSILILVTSGLSETVAQDERKLNVVVILVDDMGWTDLSGYGLICIRRPISTVSPNEV